MSTPAEWAGVEVAAGAGVAGGALCGDTECESCRVLEAGARALCSAADVDYDALDGAARRHYAAMVMSVQAAMLAAYDQTTPKVPQ